MKYHTAKVYAFGLICGFSLTFCIHLAIMYPSQKPEVQTSSGKTVATIRFSDPLPAYRRKPVPIVLCDSYLTEAIIQKESGGNRYAIGPKGERGLMQITKSTWEDMTEHPWSAAFDPIINRLVGEAYLDWLKVYISQHTIPTRAMIVAAYNGGIGKLQSVGWDVKKMSPTVQQHTQEVLALRQSIKDQE